MHALWRAKKRKVHTPSQAETEKYKCQNCHPGDRICASADSVSARVGGSTDSVSARVGGSAKSMFARVGSVLLLSGAD